ncbi:hypothetical protein [Marinomonas posidonica]|uniref:hypothetical protein n=1 Tax=Marinomonas posidonica TaxID=936476 RepID=UPI003734F340
MIILLFTRRLKDTMKLLNKAYKFLFTEAKLERFPNPNSPASYINWSGVETTNWLA